MKIVLEVVKSIFLYIVKISLHNNDEKNSNCDQCKLGRLIKFFFVTWLEDQKLKQTASMLQFVVGGFGVNWALDRCMSRINVDKMIFTLIF